MERIRQTVLQLELTSDRQLVSGTVRASDGKPHPFSGWSELFAVLQRLLPEPGGPRRSKVHETPKPAQSHQEDVPVSTTSGRTSDAVKFPRGSFKVNHPGPTTGAPKVNPATCFFMFTGGGKFTVSGGTGAYKGISGSGKVVLSIVSILGRTKSGACSENGKPVVW